MVSTYFSLHPSGLGADIGLDLGTSGMHFDVGILHHIRIVIL